MTVKGTYSSDESELTIKMDGAELNMLHKVIDQWKFKDLQSFFRFTISILHEADSDNTIWLTGDDGDPCPFTAPSKHLGEYIKDKLVE